MTNVFHFSCPEGIVEIMKDHARKLDWSMSKLLRKLIMKFDYETKLLSRKYPDMEVYQLYRELKAELNK